MAIIKLKKQEIKEQEENKKVEEEERKSPTKTVKHFDDPAVLCEDENKTGQAYNHYILNDGTAKTVISSQNVNYYDENERKWQKIDNELVETTDSYVNKRGKFKVEVSKGHKAKSVSIGNDKFGVSWEYLGRKGKTKSNNTVDLHVQNQKAKHSNQGKAVYKKVENNTDLEYILQGNGIKENIIITEKGDCYEYEFVLNTKGLKLRLSEDNKQIELFSELTNSLGVLEKKVEFVIPSPFMYDSNGNLSYDVYYEIDELGNNKYSFSVIANKDWVNSDERVFPITIDPQITENIPNAAITATQYLRDYSTSNEGNWFITNSTNLFVYDDGYRTYKVEFRISKDIFKLINYEFKELYLELPCHADGYTHSYIVIDNEFITISESQQYLTIDLKGKIKSLEEDIIITIMPEGPYQTAFYNNGYTCIVAKYVTNENLIPTKKSFALCNHAKSDVDLFYGDIITRVNDFSNDNTVFGTPIYHIYKKSSDDYNLGINYRLNIHEKFIKIKNGEFVYTDSEGMKHYFTERFYYFDFTGKKVYLNDSEKELLIITASGKIQFSAYEAYAEYISTSKLKVITTLEGINDIEYFEQRNEEIKKIEEQINSYKDVFEQYVVCNVDSLYVVHKLKNGIEDTLRFEEIISSLEENSNYHLFTKNEYFSYCSLNEQANASTTIETKEDGDTYTISVSQESKQNASNQIDNLLSKKDEEIEKIKKYYKEYLILKESLKDVKLKTPVSYLSNGQVVKGFNEYGDLIVIYDNYENFIIIEYEKYFDGYDRFGTRVGRLVDNFGKTVIFSYDHNNLLEYMSDSMGHITSYEYENGLLKTVLYDMVKTLSIEYDEYNNIIAIKDEKDKLKSIIEYDSGRTAYIKKYSLVENVSTENENECNKQIDYTYISYPNVSYPSLSNEYVVVKNNLIEEMYKFDDEGNKVEYILGDDYKVIKAEKYEYTPYWISGVAQENPRYIDYSVKQEKLVDCFTVGFSFNRFSTADYNIVTTIIDQFNNPISKVYSPIEISKTNDVVNTKTTTINYVYDNEQKLIEEIHTNEYSYLEEPIIVHKKYYYDLFGKIVKTEVYIDGEEYTNGILVEEVVYDEKGNIIKSFTYNSLDPSSKFYKEVEYDENGQVIVSYDSTGLYKTLSNYVNGKLFQTILPNGSGFGYGYNNNDLVSITQSTSEGEENSNQKVIKYGKVVELNSCNNNIKYTYDYKGRPTSISLDGVDNYARFEYTETTNSDGVITNLTERVTFASGDVYVNEYDSNGNLLKRTINEVDSFVNIYNSKNELSKVINYYGQSYEFIRDEYDRLVAVSCVDSCGGDNCSGNCETYSYNEYGSLSSIYYNYPVSEMYEYRYSADSNHRLETIYHMKNNQVVSFEYNYDSNGRKNYKKIDCLNKKIAGEKLSYYKYGDHATYLISSQRFDKIENNKITTNEILRYSYDSMGNIDKIYENGELAIKYTYDSLNRLIREDNKPLDKTTMFIYDNNGNIIKKRELGFTLKNDLLIEELDSIDKNYVYDGDKLLSYDNINISYDSFGVPSSCSQSLLYWESNKLYRIINPDSNISFEYDGLGNRILKRNYNSGKIIEYFYDSQGKLIKETLPLSSPLESIEYFYDNTGVSGISYNGVYYLYRKNILGDIIAILDSNGNVVVRYLYDGWGNHKVVDSLGNEITDTTHIGHINPIRYRGYYYDSETQLYWVSSRYYSPELCRWISPDSIEYLDPQSINGLNLYAYCNNDPVNKYDPTGHNAIGIAIFWASVVGGVVGVISQTATDVICNIVTKRPIEEWQFSSWETYVGAGVGGAAGGVVSLFAGPAASAAIDGFVASLTSMLLENATGTSNHSVEEIFLTTLCVTSFSSITAGMFDGVRSSPDELLKNFTNYSSKILKIKGMLFLESLINSLPYSTFNSFTNGLVIRPNYR